MPSHGKTRKYWITGKRKPRKQNSHSKYTISVDIQKRALKMLVTHENHMRQEHSVSVLAQRTAL